MDSQATTEGRKLDIVDDAWCEDRLPNDDMQNYLTQKQIMAIPI
jgi:hypothetical protein